VAIEIHVVKDHITLLAAVVATSPTDASASLEILKISNSAPDQSMMHSMHLSILSFFFCRRPLPFGGSPLEAYPWTSGESNHHRQSVRVAKNDALPTEPRGHLHLSILSKPIV
jgi:hypothetical protein